MPPDTISVAIYMHDLAGGGVERMRLQLIPRLRELGARITLVLHARAGALAAELPADLPVVELGGARTLADLPRLIRFLRRERPDVLVSSLDHNNIVAMLARACARRTKLVICQHNALSAEARSGASYRLVPLLYRLLGPLADAVVSVSHGVSEDLQRITGLPARKQAVIGNPVIGQDFAERAAAAAVHPWLGDPAIPVFVAVGRLVAQKDHATLLRAFARRVARGPARLLVLGDGPLRADLEALAEELNLTSHVRFLGFVANPLPLIRQAAALVLSSRYEGLGNVLIEALGCGTPVISTDCPFGPGEILGGGRFGTLVPVGDAAALADAMREDPRTRWPEATLQARAQRYTAQAAAAAYMALFEKLCRPRRDAFGLTFSPLSAEGVAAAVAGQPRGAAQGVGLVATANIDHLRHIRRGGEFARAYAGAEIITCDGFPVHAWARLRGCAVPGRVTGCDIAAALLRRADLAGQRLFFVADRPETAAGLRDWAAARALQDAVCIAVPPFGFDANPGWCRVLAASIRAHGTTILLMGVGAPRSEVFVDRHRHILPPCWALCLGQAIAIEAGTAARAPALLQRLNLEWTWRLLREPRRLAARYAGGMVAFALGVAADARAARRVLPLVALALAMGGCAATGNPQARQADAADFHPVAEFPLQPGDEVEVKFPFTPELDERQAIRSDGNISLALIDDVHAAGLTVDGLHDVLVRRYANQLRRPELTVLLRGTASNRAFVGGEVVQQGPVALVAPTTVSQAVLMAQGMKDTAYQSQVLVMRPEPDGHAAVRVVDLGRVLRGEDPKQDVTLQPMDIVYVPQSPIARVDLFVDQYIRRILPTQPNIGYTFYGK
jgi:exopolysaccharide biosynthesis WecB/TagA/CpsF family protein